MYTRESFGSFYPVDSIIHKINPIVKIINFLIAFILVILSNSPLVIGSLFIFVIIMMILSRVPLKFYLETFWHLRFIYLIIAILCVCFNTSVTLLIVYILKVVIVVEYLNIISYATSPSENIYGIEKFLSVFNFLYLPVSSFATKINNILRYFPIYMDTKNQVLKSSYSRGVKSSKRMFFTTRRLTKRNIDEIKNASELRLYNVKQYRTNYRTSKIGFTDILFLVFHILLIVVYAVEEGLI